MPKKESIIKYGEKLYCAFDRKVFIHPLSSLSSDRLKRLGFSFFIKKSPTNLFKVRR